MVTLRCTQKLLKRMHLTVEDLKGTTPAEPNCWILLYILTMGEVTNNFENSTDAQGRLFGAVA